MPKAVQGREGKRVTLLLGARTLPGLASVQVTPSSMDQLCQRLVELLRKDCIMTLLLLPGAMYLTITFSISHSVGGVCAAGWMVSVNNSQVWPCSRIQHQLLSLSRSSRELSSFWPAIHRWMASFVLPVRLAHASLDPSETGPLGRRLD